MHVCVVIFRCCLFQTLPSSKVRTGEGFGMLPPTTAYMSDSMPNRSGSHRDRTYPDRATSGSAVSVGHPGVPPHPLGPAAGSYGPIQSGTTPRRRGMFATLGKGFASSLRVGRGVPSASAPNLGDASAAGFRFARHRPHGHR